VPADQRGVASAIKAILELVPLILLGITIAPLVGSGRFGLAVLATGAVLLLLMLHTVILVKERPIEEKPDMPLAPTMLRVLGMLGGIGSGAVAGIVIGGVAGGLVGLIAWAIAGQTAAMSVAIAVGGITAMAVAVVAGVWGGALATIGQDARRRPSFTWWMANRLMFLAAITSIQSFAPFFLMVTFEVSRERAATMTGTLMMFVGIFTLLSALPSGWLADRIGQKPLLLFSALCAALGTAVVLGTVLAPGCGSSTWLGASWGSLPGYL
jgi:hypothetical protein